MNRLIICITLSILFLSSCAITKFAGYYISSGSSNDGKLSGNIYRSDSTAYSIGTLPGDWRRSKVKGGDLVFNNAKLQATITVNSTCDGKKTAYSMVVLSESLLIGINDKELQGRQEAQVDGQEALYSVYSGNFGGVPIKIATLVFKKGVCIYDFTYASSPDSFDTGYTEFQTFASQFRVL
jgi:hypothetical protein